MTSIVWFRQDLRLAVLDRRLRRERRRGRSTNERRGALERPQQDGLLPHSGRVRLDLPVALFAYLVFAYIYGQTAEIVSGPIAGTVARSDALASLGSTFSRAALTRS